MVSYKEIHKSIVDKLLNNTTIDVLSTNIEESIIRPSFYIDYDNIESEDFMQSYLDRSMTVRIYFFATERSQNKIENLDMMDTLNDIFIKDGVLQIDENTSVLVSNSDISIVDDVLHYYFDIELSEEYERVDTLPYMEHLELK